MDPRLARNVRLWKDGCHSIAHLTGKEAGLEQHYKSSMSRFFHVCEKFSEYVHSIEILLHLSMIPVLYEILTRYCPNLERLRIREWNGRSGVRNALNDEVDRVLSRPLLVRRTLTGLNVHTTQREDGRPLLVKIMTELIVKSAPNLETLVIPGHLKFKSEWPPGIAVVKTWLIEKRYGRLICILKITCWSHYQRNYLVFIVKNLV